MTTTVSTSALVLLCGSSFSGKSTAAAQLRDGLAAEVVSLDAINAERGLDGGQGIAVEEWVRTNDEARRRAGALLAAGRVVVVDDTASLRFLRDAWREVAAAAERSSCCCTSTCPTPSSAPAWLPTAPAVSAPT